MIKQNSLGNKILRAYPIKTSVILVSFDFVAKEDRKVVNERLSEYFETNIQLHHEDKSF